MIENLGEVTTKLPTFLQLLLQDDGSIKLVYEHKSELKPYFKANNTENHNETTVSELELTGTPLMTDLGGNDSLCTDVIPTIPPNWTSDEARYHPVSLRQARTYLNFNLNKYSDHLNRPIYCLCDGNDPQRTVVLGMSKKENKMTRTQVHVLPCCNENDEITTLEYMKEDHIANVRGNVNDIKINFMITKCYYLWGYNLKNCSSFHNAEHSGSVAVKVSNNVVDDITSKGSQSGKMTLQVIIGHSNSPLKSFWEELALLQSYINLLANIKQLSGSSVISESNLNIEEVTFLISELLVSNVNCFKKNVMKNHNLENVRRKSTLDGLWNILISCGQLSDLRDCLHFFFEKLISIDMKVQILSDDLSAMADIVSGIVEGKLAVPSLSFTQSLELLVDLGLEKLKNDYLVKMNDFCTSAKEQVMKRWRTLCLENVPTTSQSFKRKSRMSINPTSSIIDLSKNRLKLSYLECMHKVAEFMFLYTENVKFSEEGFDYFCEAVCNHFIATEGNMSPVCDISKPKLCEFTFDLFPADSNITAELSEASCLVKMTSTINSCEVSTVFYFSEFPIFPPNIFNNYDILFDSTNSKSMYVTKLVRYVGNR